MVNSIVVPVGASHPRSLSSATVRFMVERGDFRVLHQPFFYAYYKQDQRRVMPEYQEVTGTPTTYTEVRDWILQLATQQATCLSARLTLMAS